jgi:formate dehydrogenase major subunit/formate dehydrogenase alpha subunit
MVNQAIEPIGDARQDWWVTAEIAKRMIEERGKRKEERKIDLSAAWAGWDYQSAEDIMKEINALTPSYGGITYERLRRGERLQWPCPTTEHAGTPILHTTQFTRGKGKFAPIDHIPPAERPNDEYPMIMNTGRVLYHWHGGQMTRRAEGIMQLYGEALIEVNPDDAIKIGLAASSRVRVTSRRGSIEAKAWITERVPIGMVYANFHFPASSANELTHAALDPVAKIPEYKITAVKIELAM